MTEVLWTLPVPSTALTGEAETLEIRRGREVSLQMAWDHVTGEGNATLFFRGVEAYRCTYMTACTDAMLPAFDRVIDCGETDWLDSVRAENIRHRSSPDGLRHLMIYFDDGPCYEFICRSFQVE